MLELIKGAWHWSISGLLISLVMLLLIKSGKRFGVSSSFKTICAIGGAGKKIDYFDYNWRSHYWLLIFILGSIIGGTIGSTLLANSNPVKISPQTVTSLKSLGINAPMNIEEGRGFLPEEIFSFSNLFSMNGFIIIILGGFLIGFGTRWAGGCTSGHAISGLSNLQLPSLVAVVGFFIGGLLSTHLILPLLF